MLNELKVSNFAIIDEIDVHFKSGLNVLSGETGTGKSVLLKSLSLLMGEKASSDMVRSGVEQAHLEGFFDLSNRPDIIERAEEMGVEFLDDTLVVKRVIGANGKSRIYLNGSLSPLTSLRDLISPLITLTSHAAPLIEMTGQHDNRHLQNKTYHLDLLDQYSANLEKAHEFQEAFHQLKDLEQEIADLEQNSQDREQKLDFLKFQLQEIDALGLVSGEEEILEAKVKRLKSSQKLQDFFTEAIESIYSADDSALVRVHHLLQRAQDLEKLDSSLSDLVQTLNQSKVMLEEVTLEVRNSVKNLDSEEDLGALEERLNDLRRLQKKFGGTADEILSAYDRMFKEVENLEGSDDKLIDLRNQKKSLEKNLMNKAKELHSRRISGAQLLVEGVNSELRDLNMKGVLFEIAVEELKNLSHTGISDVEFLIRPSKKDSARPLAKVASGGELSRILLALKTVIGASEVPRTYLFDEVDTGVSGETAEKVGRKLTQMAKGQQVICVTHLPQVAAFANHHYLIDKAQSQGRAAMKVRLLKPEERTKEIARLISGEKITKTSLKHAEELIQEFSKI
ncbi:MAG: DNA repair protein RecN [Bdellovibrionaceae bacterium]|nr:DNA repair protein RecN [Pseudobdellovibrionaceae bacterium]|tara:strand:- start:576 stop:2273 length:1698 start_codon:yes stop_codon:yes gene_type:complete